MAPTGGSYAFLLTPALTIAARCSGFFHLVGVGEVACAGEVLLHVSLVGKVGCSLLEDDEVQRERLAQRSHHRELVEVSSPSAALNLL